jgi:glycerol uptake facilitator protein
VEQKSPASYVAEFLGTFFLVFAITMVVSLFVNPQGTGSDWVAVGFVHGFVLFLIVATLGYVSGAHVNPAVTVAAMVLRTIKTSDGIVYILLQLAGAVAGALMTKFILLDDLADQQNVGAVALNFSLISNSFAGVVAEGLGTFLLVWAVIGVAMNPRANRAWAPLVIGTTLGFAVIVLGPLTGGALNPARWFGPALVAGEWDDFWVWIIGPTVGAILAALSYWYLFVVERPGWTIPGGPPAPDIDPD